MKHVPRIRTTKRARTPALREAMQFSTWSRAHPAFGPVSPGCTRPAQRCARTSSPPAAAATAARPALQLAFRVDWQMRQRRFAGDRAPARLSPPNPRGGRAPRHGRGRKESALVPGKPHARAESLRPAFAGQRDAQGHRAGPAAIDVLRDEPGANPADRRARRIRLRSGEQDPQAARRGKRRCAARTCARYRAIGLHARGGPARRTHPRAPRGSAAPACEMLGGKRRGEGIFVVPVGLPPAVLPLLRAQQPCRRATAEYRQAPAAAVTSACAWHHPDRTPRERRSWYAKHVRQKCGNTTPLRCRWRLINSNPSRTCASRVLPSAAARRNAQSVLSASAGYYGP